MKTATDVQLQRASLLLEQGRYRDAESNLRQVLTEDPRNEEALALLGRCYLNSRRLEEGIEVVQQAIALDPGNDFYYYLLGFGHYQQRRLTEAFGFLTKAISLNPYAAEYFGLLAYVLIDERQFAKGLEKADEGLALDAENGTCLNARSVALNKLGRTDAAIETMQHALAQDPENEITHTTVGWNFLEKGRHEEARHHFREALRIDPDLESAQAGLKEAMKSQVAPYRWLLRYSFWAQNKGRKVQAFLPFLLYIVFRVVGGLLSSNEQTRGLAWLVAAFYILFVVSSWSMNAVANFFLLFNPLGRYALNRSERWSAICTVSVLAAGLALLGLAQFTALGSGTDYEGGLFLCGLVLISLALPFGEAEFPLQLRGPGWRHRMGNMLLLGGGLSLLLYVLFPPAGFIAMSVYALLFLIYNWSGLRKG